MTVQETTVVQVGHTTFLLDKTFQELRSIAKELGIKFTRTATRIEIIDLIMQNIGEEENLKGADEMGLSIYEVRYVGPGGMNIYNSNSTLSRREYRFTNGDWIEVEKIDFEQFYKKIAKSIAADNNPHWNVRRRNKFGDMKNFFASKINFLSSKKPKRVVDIVHMTDEGMAKLKQANIRSFTDFVALPKEYLIHRLKLSRTQAQEMIDDARRGIDA